MLTVILLVNMDIGIDMTDKIRQWEDPKEWMKRNRHPVNIHSGTGDSVVITWDDRQDTVYPSLEDAISYLKSINREYIIHVPTHIELYGDNGK